MYGGEISTDKGNFDALPFETTDVLWHIIKVWNDYQTIVLQGGTSSSKCLGIGTKIRMFDMSLKNVEDIEVGDQLLGIDGNPRNVLKLYRGQDELYRVKQNRGIDYVVNKEHILVFSERGKDRMQLFTTKNFIKYSKTKRRRFRGVKFIPPTVDTSNISKEVLALNNYRYDRIESIISLGIGDYYGFEIDGDHLFFLEDFTVTHNTYSALQWMFLKGAEKKRDMLVVGESIPNLKLGAYKDFQTIWNTNETTKKFIIAWNKSEMTFTFFNGSKIKFTSYLDEQSAKSGKRDITFINEANGIEYGIYRQLAIRTYEKMIIDYNPSSAFWVHRKLIGKPGVIRMISTYLHNRFCPQSVIDQLLEYKVSDPYMWKVYGLGHTGQIEGVIFKNVEFISDAEFPDITDLKNFGYGADYGYAADPNVLVCAGIYQGNLYAKLLWYDRYTKTQLEDIVAEWEEVIEDFDAVIAFDNSQAREQADILLNVHGFNIKAANRRGGAILSGIGLLKSYKLFIVDDEGEHWFDEQQNYRWKRKDGKDLPSPVEKHNHCFIGSTLISTERGLVPIKDVVIGDMVYNSSDRLCKVVDSFLSCKDAKVNHYRLYTNEHTYTSLSCTPNHKIWINKEWQPISKLKKGDKIKSSVNGELQEAAVVYLMVTLTFSQDVYDLSIEGTHEYIAEGVLVHNCWDSLRYYCLENLVTPELPPFEENVETI